MTRPTYEPGSYRLQVRLPEDWREAIATAAAAKGQTASEFVRTCVASQLPKRTRAKLDAVVMGRPKAE